MALVVLAVLLVLRPADARASDTYNVVIKGGRVLDPRNKIDGTFDVAIAGGKIARISPDIPVTGVPTVVRAAGMVVVPGLVDIHAHVFHGPDLSSEYANGPRAVPPDGFTFRAGVTTVVDAGGSGWRNFPVLKRQVIDIAKTRVLAFLNIVGGGMSEGPVEQNLADMDARLCALRASENKDVIVGIKTAHFRGPEWTPVDRAVEAGKLANIPVMVDFGEFVPERPFRDLIGKHLRPGDIYTHTYLGVVPMLDGKGRVNPFMSDARKRGVIFDVGHGGGSFVFRQAVPAMKQGFRPDTLSTDLHINSMNSGMKDLSNLMSPRAGPDRRRFGRGRGGVQRAQGQVRLHRRRRRPPGRRSEAGVRAHRARWQRGLGPERHRQAALAGTEAEARSAGALAAQAGGKEVGRHNRMLSISRVAPTNAATSITPGTSRRSIGARVSALRIST
jgi:dihydroorotase